MIALTLALVVAADSMPVCVVSRPAASPLDTVELSVLEMPPASRWRWTVTGGDVVAGDSVSRWALERAGIGVQMASATREGDAAASCSVRVAVVPPGGHMGSSLFRARMFLTPTTREEAGYAVYSYLLLGARPDSADRARVRTAVAEYVRHSEDFEAFHAAQRRDRGAFDMSYLPVALAPARVDPDTILAHYDYAAAQGLLRKLPGDVRGVGPYLVSVAATPLSRADSLPKRSIVQDLSTVPTPVVGPWVRRFVDVTSQQRFDDGMSLRGFVLRLRTAIGVAALGLSDVTDSLAKWNETWAKLVTVKE
jgi:hypothetical protein